VSQLMGVGVPCNGLTSLVKGSASDGLFQARVYLLPPALTVGQPVSRRSILSLAEAHGQVLIPNGSDFAEPRRQAPVRGPPG